MMSKNSKSMKLTLATLTAVAILAISFAVIASAASQKKADADDAIVHEQWEYLVVAGPTTNFSPTGNPSLRKESAGVFARESFVLEQDMDKLGARGWELVAV